MVPASHATTLKWLRYWNINCVSRDSVKARTETLAKIPDAELAEAVETALAYDADALVVTTQAWFPFIDDLDEFGLFLTDTTFLKHQCELFVRGHDVPWAFPSEIWNLTWTAFYQMTEQQTFETGMSFLSFAQKKKADAEGQETCRSLLHNRVPNLCFTRDRLLFYDIQRRVSLRSKWKRQEFRFEIAYYLNFYYLLLYGGFDQIALLVNRHLGLGIPEKKVGATYESFLNPLKAKNAAIYAVFTDLKHTEFIKRVGSLRHYASHRGQLMPTKLLEKPQNDPTNEEPDAQIAAAGLDETLALMPSEQLRDSFRETLRYNFRAAYYEKSGKMVDGVVPIEIDGKPAFIQPLIDTDWNFARFLLFMNQVFAELENAV